MYYYMIFNHAQTMGWRFFSYNRCVIILGVGGGGRRGATYEFKNINDNILFAYCMYIKKTGSTVVPVDLCECLWKNKEPRVETDRLKVMNSTCQFHTIISHGMATEYKPLMIGLTFIVVCGTSHVSFCTVPRYI